MAVTYGFYNSLNGDRTYNAEQMSAIFDGIITDGVFSTIGDALMTIAGTGMQVIVKTGKCWFNSTWTLNDAPMTLAIDTADVSLTRIDAVVLEVNSGVSIRANSIKILKGTPSANPAKPTLASDEDLHQYALAYVTVGAGVTSIAASNIEVNVGKTTCPFITSVLQQTSITDLFNAWDEEFNTWFENLQSQMEGDVATNLQNQIDRLKIGSTAKAQYNLTSSLPNDYIEWIGKYNEYWWSLLHGQAYSYYKLNFAPISSFISYSNSSTSNKVYYSYSLDFDENTGSYSLHEPENITMHTGDISRYKKDVAALAALAADAPFYMYTQGNSTIYKVPQGATAYDGTAQMTQTFTYYTYRDSDDDLVMNYGYGTGNPVSAISAEFIQVPAGETTYEHSTNRNAYPDSGTVDGVTYTYLGKPFEKMPRIANIMTGTYIGTGVGGSGSPNIISTPFAAQMIFIQINPSSINQVSLFATDTSPTGVFYGTVRSTDGYSNVSANNAFTFSSDSVSWYLSSASMSLSYFTNEGKATAQLNSANVSYRYLIIG